MRPVLIQSVLTVSANNNGDRQVVSQEFLDAHRGSARTSAAVWGGECLVKVQMNHIEPKIPWTDEPHESIKVCPIVVQETSASMHEFGNLRDVLLEQSHGVRVGQHDGRHRIVHELVQRIHVDPASLIGGNGHDLESRHRCRRRICPVGRIGDQHFRALGIVVTHEGMDNKHASELAMGATCRLQCEVVHTSDLLQRLLQLKLHLQDALVVCGIIQWVTHSQP